jgi:hypothetical protein
MKIGTSASVRILAGRLFKDNDRSSVGRTFFEVGSRNYFNTR